VNFVESAFLSDSAANISALYPTKNAKQRKQRKRRGMKENHSRPRHPPPPLPQTPPLLRPLLIDSDLVKPESAGEEFRKPLLFEGERGVVD